MPLLLSALALSLSLLPPACFEDNSAGLLETFHADASGCLSSQVQRYVPRAGDLVFFDGNGKIWQFLESIAGTEPPDHMAMVVALPDGRTALLEAAPNQILYIFILDIPERLNNFKGNISIRRIRRPLSPAQSACLTKFAMAQEGKEYALVRYLLQITPFRSRGALRSKVFGTTCYDRKRWICSELVVVACMRAGLLNAEVLKASVIYPRDLWDDDRYDLSRFWEKPDAWKPARNCIIKTQDRRIIPRRTEGLHPVGGGG